MAPPVSYASRSVEPPIARDQDFEYAASEEPPLPETRLETEHAFYPDPAPLRAASEPAEPEPVPLPAASVPLFSWPEVSPAAPLAPELPSAPTEQPASTSRIAPAPPAYAAPEPATLPVTMAPAQASAPDYRLFNAIGRLSDTPPPPSQPQVANTTLAMLRSRIENALTDPLPFQGIASPPPAAAEPAPPTLLAAGAVTVPLSDVMRLIAAGASPPASPFEAFRSALSAQPPR
ncbi:MAG: hypothetical protein NTW56_21980 [Alphaproteobacteria bacterium]|nr:hypothetical protein [Alphaproteobacteria bacterium]